MAQPPNILRSREEGYEKLVGKVGMTVEEFVAVFNH